MAAINSALVIGASGGIGDAFVSVLSERIGAERVSTLSRRDDGFDITDEPSLAAQAARLSETGAAFDFIIDATGTLEPAGFQPEKSFGKIDPVAMSAAFAVNAIGPALLFKHFAKLLPAKDRSVFATLSARVGSIGDNRLGGWVSYRASKAALNQIVRCAAIEIGRTKPDAIILALHPGTIETALTRKYARGRYTASPTQAADQMINVLLGMTAEASGKFFDYAGEEITW